MRAGRSGAAAVALLAAAIGATALAPTLGTPSPFGAARAAEAVVAFDDAADRERYERLLTEYRCLKCQNQNLADSGASIAGDLREQIRSRVVAGDDDAAIDAYLVSRYGEFVRYRPRFGRSTALLWIGPFALLAAGLGAGALLARRGGGAPSARAPEPVEADEARLAEARRLLGD